MPIFYRALTFSDHLQRWEKGLYTSYHHLVPWKWVEIWENTESVNLNDYPISINEGIFTQRAVQEFIVFAPLHNTGDIWSEEERRKVSELAGVCAFTTPEAAYEYGHNSLTGKQDAEYYVVFEGERLCDAPEDLGVVAEVKNPLSFFSASQFRQRYHIR